MMIHNKVQCNCKYECNGIGTDCKVVCNDDCGSEIVNEETDTCNNDCPSNSSCKNGVCYCDEGQGSPDYEKKINLSQSDCGTPDPWLRLRK